MSLCHCQCQSDHHTVLQSKNHQIMSIWNLSDLGAGADWMGMSLEVVHLRNSFHTVTFIDINAPMVL